MHGEPAYSSTLAPGDTTYLCFSGDQRIGDRCPISLVFLLGGNFQGSGLAASITLRRKPRDRKRPRRRRPQRGQLQGPVHLPDGATTLGISKRDDSHLQLGLWAVDTINPNSMSAGLEYIQNSRAEVVCIQETKVTGAALASAERIAKRAQWSLSIEPARVTEAGGMSAGTAVAVRAHIGHAAPPDFPWHCELDSRVKVSWVGAVCRGGFFMDRRIATSTCCNILLGY